MRLTGVSGERRGPEDRRKIQEVSQVQSGVVLLQGPRRAALVRAQESLRSAVSSVRPQELRDASRHQVSVVQGGYVLLQQAPFEARGCVPGAVRVGV
jgi:hypothetical protein